MSDADKLKQAIVSEDLNKLKKVLRQSRRTELHALHACAQHGYLDGLNYLISKKWDVNARDGENWTALHSSCHSGHLYSVELLLDNGADPSIQTGALPLHYFVRIQRQADLPALFTRLFHLLIPENVNVDTTTVKSETALHDASFRGREVAVKLLLKANANPDVSNKYGDYPLHLAVRGGHPGVVKLLLEAGASTSVSNNREGTPMELAKLNQNEEIIALLAGFAAENDAVHEDGVENGDTFTNGDANGHHHGVGVAESGEHPEAEDQLTTSAYALHNDGTPFAYPMVPAGGVSYQGNGESHYEDAAAPVRDPPPAMPVPQAPAPVVESTTDSEPYAGADASQYTSASQYTDPAHYANGGQYAPSMPAMYGDGTQYPSQMGMGTYNPYMSNAFMQLQMMQMMHQRMSQAQMGQYPQAGQGDAGGVVGQASYGAGMQYPPQFAQQYYSQQFGSQGSVSRGGGYPQQPQVQQPPQMGGYPSYASASEIARPGQQQQQQQAPQQQYSVNTGMADPSQSAYGGWPQQYGVAQGAPPAVNPGYGQAAPVGGVVGAVPQQQTDEQYQQQQQAYLAAIQAQQAQLAQQLAQQGYPTAQGGSRPPSYDSANNL